MDKEKEKEFNQRIADFIIAPINGIIDIPIQAEPDLIERMESVLIAISKTTRTLAAFPAPETLAKAEEREGQERYFKAIIELLKARASIIENASKGASQTPGEAILKQFGL